MKNKGIKILLATLTTVWVYIFILSQSINAYSSRNARYSNNNDMPKLESAAVVVKSIDDDKILFSKNAFETRSIASITKLMTALTFLELKPDLHYVYSIPREFFRPEFKTRLRPDMKFTALDLLYIMLLSSDNVAARCLADISGLSEREFVQMMNLYARRLGLRNTKFADPTGFDMDNVSTPYEISLIMQKVLEQPLLSNIVKTKHFSVSPLNYYYNIDYVNTNRLLHNPDYQTLGGKTGFISRAGYCLVTTNRLENGKEVVMVFLGARHKFSRFGDAVRMLTWLNENCEKINSKYSKKTVNENKEYTITAKENEFGYYTKFNN